MKVRHAAALFLALLTAAASAPARIERPDSPGGIVCIRVRAEARYRNYGYDHLVTLESGCDRAVLCAVSSDVNPKPVERRVEPRERAEVLLWRGSPSQEFIPRVECHVAP